MIINMIGGGGGGAALNFDVVGGTSQPSNPKENTIWVNTSTAITDWVFSDTHPTAASGRVWISTGTSSSVEFNALKKNGIQVYPISAKQYVGGAWVDKTAMIYQGGEWVVLDLFALGTWEASSYSGSYDSMNGTAPTVTQEDGIVTVAISKNNTVSYAVFSNQFDFSKYSVLRCEISANGCEPRLEVIDSNKSKWTAYARVSFAKDYGGGNWTEVELDLTSVNQVGYVAIGFYNQSGSTLKAKNFKLE